jgi:DNA polymerase-3 subunit delta
VSGPVLLLWGESDFLLREAAHEAFGETTPREIDGAEWVAGATSDLATPSLLGEERGLLVAGAQALPPEALEEIAEYTRAPVPDARLVLTASVGPRAKGPPRAVVKAIGDGAETRKVAVERRELATWVLARARARGLQGTPAGATALVQTVGEDPGTLDQAVAQLADAHPAEGLTPQTVAAQFRGLGDRRIWELCDAAFGRDLPTALRYLTAMLDAGEEPLMILGGIAARLRDLLRVRSLPPKAPPAEVARAAGLRFEWQGRRYRDQARKFGEGELRELHRSLVEADALLKQGGNGQVVLPMLLSRIAGEGPRGRAASSRARAGAR